MMYKYSYGEADGPFKCEHNKYPRSGRVGGYCETSTWCIYADKDYEDTRRPLMVGVALCDKHAPYEIKVRKVHEPFINNAN